MVCMGWYGLYEIVWVAWIVWDCMDSMGLDGIGCDIGVVVGIGAVYDMI